MRRQRSGPGLGTRRHAHREGRRDAGVGIPGEEWTTASPSLTAIRYIARMVQEQIGLDYYKGLRSILPRWQKAALTLRHRRNDLALAEMEHRHAEAEATRTAGQAREVSAGQALELKPWLSPRWRLVVLPLLFIGDYFLTAVAFHILPLRANEIYAIVVTINVALILLAHYVGASIARADTVEHSGRAKREQQIAYVAAVFLLLGAAAVSVYRQAYLVQTQAQHSTYLRLGVVSGVGFFVLQLVVAAATTVFAFMTERDPRARRVSREQAEAQVAAARVHQTRQAVEQARQQLREAELAYVDSTAQYELVRGDYEQTAAASREYYEHLTYEWWSANVRRRHVESSGRYLSVPLVPINPGAWTEHRLVPYELPAASASSAWLGDAPATTDDFRPADQQGSNGHGTATTSEERA